MDVMQHSNAATISLGFVKILQNKTAEFLWEITLRGKHASNGYRGQLLHDDDGRSILMTLDHSFAAK